MCLCNKTLGSNTPYTSIVKTLADGIMTDNKGLKSSLRKKPISVPVAFPCWIVQEEAFLLKLNLIGVCLGFSSPTDLTSCWKV